MMILFKWKTNLLKTSLKIPTGELGVPEDAFSQPNNH